MDMNEETHNKIRFITFMIAQFAKAYKMGKREAYLYLRQYGGFDYLKNHWWAFIFKIRFGLNVKCLPFAAEMEVCGESISR